MMNVVWLDEAIKDLLAIGHFIVQDDPVAACRTVEAIKAATDILTQFPQSGRSGRVKGTRELVVDGLPYIIPYVIHKKEVRILAVMHAARKWPDGFTS